MCGEYDDVVAALAVLLPPEVLDDLADERALGVPVDQARAAHLVHAVEVELLAELAMVAALDLFQKVQIVFQLLAWFAKAVP